MALTKVKGHILADDLALGGNPTTSTQSTGNNTTRIATTAFVQTELSALVDSSPSALNTLNELAAALGDDANFSTTVNSNIATKAPLAGPTFTGDVDIDGSDDLRLRFLSGSTFKGGIQVPTSTGDMISGAAVDDLAIRSQANMLFSSGGNTERMRIDSSGNVGIGGSPTNYSDHKTLSLYGNTGTGAGFIEFNDTSGNADAVIFSDDGNLFINADYDNTAASSSIRFRVDGSSEKMRIDSSGNVGIGTTSPSTKLHIQDSDYTTMSIQAGTTSHGAILNLGDSGDIDYGSIAQFASSAGEGGRMRFIAGTTETMNLRGGNVGIGTSSPAQPLSVMKNSSTSNTTPIAVFDTQVAGDYGIVEINSGADNNYRPSTLRFKEGGNQKWEIGGTYQLVDDSFGIRTTASDYKMVIQANGNVGIGTDSPGRLLEVLHSAGAHTPVLRLTGNHASAYSGGLEFYSGYGPKTTAEIHSTASGSQGGEFWINVRSQGGNAMSRVLAVNNSGRLRLTGCSENFSGALNIMGEVGNSYDAVQLYHNSTTVVGRIRTTASSTAYNTSSDYRLKENVDYTWDATTRLKQLKPARFNFTVDDTNTLVDGFLAHEVSSIVPEAITGEKDAVDSDGNPDYQGIDQSKLVPLLVKTIQELEARITTLES